MEHFAVVRALARAFLAGDPTIEAIVARASQTLALDSARWLPPLAARYLRTYANQTRPRHRDVVQFLIRDRGFARAWSKNRDELTVERWLTGPQQMQPVAAAGTWPVPAIESIGALAEWFSLTPGELDWFADLKDLGRRAKDRPQLRHYHYRILKKESGSVRLIEAPKPRLKQLQRQILSQVLDKIPIHPVVHGFAKGRCIKTFVAPHVGQRVVLRMDLQDFFPSIPGARIQAFFRTVGYPEPASPALANLCAYRVDCRLSGLAKSAGATYTRYADDLAFSGDESFERRVERFSTHVAVILHEEGFTVHHRKTRIMRQGVRQHLAGLVANQKLNIIRADFDRLKAILTNCIRHGPASQNLPRAHLEGRVGFVESINPAKGKRLRQLLNQIQW